MLSVPHIRWKMNGASARVGWFLFGQIIILDILSKAVTLDRIGSAFDLYHFVIIFIYRILRTVISIATDAWSIIHHRVLSLTEISLVMCVHLQLHICQSNVSQLILIEWTCSSSHHTKISRVLERLLIRNFTQEATTTIRAMHLVWCLKVDVVSRTLILIHLEACISPMLRWLTVYLR